MDPTTNDVAKEPIPERAKESVPTHDEPLPPVPRRAVLVGAVLGAAACKPNSSHGGGPNLDPPTSPSLRAATPTPLGGRAVGFMLSHEQFTTPQLVELGVLAEKAGFDVLAASDHLQPWQANEGHSSHAWITLAAVGQRTDRIWLGTTVTCPSFRHNPAVVAEGFSSLSSLFPGRVYLGVGSGEALNEQAATGEWPPWAERSERLVEATDVIRQLWSGRPVVRKGKYFSINARLYDPPTKPVPLLMAGNGPKAMYRSGRYGDGLITDPKTWKEHKGEFQRGARDAGKDPARMPVFIESFVVVGGENEARAAAQFWRFIPKAWKPYFNVADPSAIEQRAKAEVPLEKVYADWTVSTDPNAHVKAITELFDSGATEVTVHSGQADQKHLIDFYGKEVLPRLRRG